MIALTEVFHSCFISEQRAGEKSYIESGYICLSKEQIMNHAPSNLLATFFSGVRAVKKTLTEQVICPVYCQKVHFSYQIAFWTTFRYKSTNVKNL